MNEQPPSTPGRPHKTGRVRVSLNKVADSIRLAGALLLVAGVAHALLEGAGDTVTGIQVAIGGRPRPGLTTDRLGGLSKMAGGHR